MSNLVLLNRNVFGYPTGAILTEWLPESGPIVPFTRETSLPPVNTKVGIPEPGPRKIAQQPPPEGAFDPEELTHRDREVLSPSTSNDGTKLAKGSCALHH